MIAYPSEYLDLVNDYRTSLLAHKYYGRLHRRTRMLDRSLDVVLGIGTGSLGGVGAWSLWNHNATLTISWCVVGLVCGLLAAVRPFLGLLDTAARYHRVSAGYGQIAFDLDKLVRTIRSKQRIGNTLLGEHVLIREQTRWLEDDVKRSSKLLHLCMDEVNAQCPPESFVVKFR